MNWISPTGFSPCAAIPTHAPLMSSSASGVSITRSGPNRVCNPAVARNTPPLMPTSSPSTITSRSSSMARASARLMASTSVTSATIRSFDPRALALVHLRQRGIEMVEHGRGRAWRSREIALDGHFHALLAIGRQAFLVGLAPGLAAYEIGSQPGDGVLLPARLHVLRNSIARGIVCGCVIAKPISDGLDEARAVAVAGRRNCLLGRRPHGNDVVAVHLFARESGGDRLLGKRRTGGLEPKRYRYGPSVVVDDEYDGELPHAGKIHCFVYVALGGSA